MRVQVGGSGKEGIGGGSQRLREARDEQEQEAEKGKKRRGKKRGRPTLDEKDGE